MVKAGKVAGKLNVFVLSADWFLLVDIFVL